MSEVNRGENDKLKFTCKMTVKLLYSLLLIKNVDNDDDDDMQIYSAHKIKHA